MSPAYDSAIREALGKLTKRQLATIEHVLARRGGAQEIAQKNLISVEVAMTWIAESRRQLHELVTLELQRARVYVIDGPSPEDIEERVKHLLRQHPPAERVPAWLRGALGVRVRWRGPFTPAAYLADAALGELAGLYQILGDHVVTGPRTLLYLGRAPRMANRLTERWLRLLDAEHDIAIHIGEIDPDSSATGDAILEQLEILTSWWHTPALSKRHDAYEGPLLVVQNLGKRGKLLPMYASNWPTGMMETI